MDVLVLGGTSFVGRAIVADLLERGHNLTLFSRGVTGSDLFPQVARRTGDRETGDYAGLREQRWDAVIDVSGYVPRHVAQAADAIGDTGRYLFISTGSVYTRDGAADHMTESSPRLAPYRESEIIDGETYGPLKVACEDDVQARWGARASIVRPGIVSGPHDSTDRFTYWVRRAAKGGRVAVPGRLDQPVQVVDSRDLARLVTIVLEQDLETTVNAVGPRDPVTLSELIGVCADGAALDLVPVTPIERFPLVMADPSYDLMFRRNAALAYELGMPATPLAQTASDVRAWDLGRGLPALLEGFTDEQEADALQSA